MNNLHEIVPTISNFTTIEHSSASFHYPLSKPKIKLLKALNDFSNQFDNSNVYTILDIQPIPYLLDTPNWEDYYDTLILEFEQLLNHIVNNHFPDPSNVGSIELHRYLDIFLLHLLFENSIFKENCNFQKFYNEIDLNVYLFENEVLMPINDRFPTKAYFFINGVENVLFSKKQFTNFEDEDSKNGIRLNHTFNFYTAKNMSQKLINENFDSSEFYFLHKLTTIANEDNNCKEQFYQFCKGFNLAQDRFIFQHQFNGKTMMEIQINEKLSDLNFNFNFKKDNKLQINDLDELNKFITSLIKIFEPTYLNQIIEKKSYNVFWIFQDKIIRDIINNLYQICRDVIQTEKTSEVDILKFQNQILCLIGYVSKQMPKEMLINILTLVWHNTSQILCNYISEEATIKMVFTFITLLMKIDSENYQPLLELYNEVIHFLSNWNEFVLNRCHSSNEIICV